MSNSSGGTLADCGLCRAGGTSKQFGKHTPDTRVTELADMKRTRCAHLQRCAGADVEHLDTRRCSIARAIEHCLPLSFARGTCRREDKLGCPWGRRRRQGCVRPVAERPPARLARAGSAGRFGLLIIIFFLLLLLFHVLAAAEDDRQP